jgi:CO/xanthine dehydrogenase FAD-binding subunit
VQWCGSQKSSGRGVVGRTVPVITDTLLIHSDVRVRNVATIGGNLAHADPHMDLLPALIALGASVRAYVRALLHRSAVGVRSRTDR